MQLGVFLSPGRTTATSGPILDRHRPTTHESNRESIFPEEFTPAMMLPIRQIRYGQGSRLLTLTAVLVLAAIRWSAPSAATQPPKP